MMMNGLGLIPPSAAATNPELSVIATLLAALADPAATRIRLAEIAAKIDEYNTLRDDAKTALEKLQTETVAAGKKIEDDRTAADAEIQRKRTQLDIDAAA